MLLFTALALASPSAPTLAQRDYTGCAALGEPTAELRAELLTLTAPETMPPATPMRAAGCLAELFGGDTEVVDRFVAWQADPAVQGLAMMVLGSVERMPEASAVRVLQAGLDSPQPRVLRKAETMRAASGRPALSALQPAPKP